MHFGLTEKEEAEVLVRTLKIASAWWYFFQRLYWNSVWVSLREALQSLLVVLGKKVLFEQPL